MKFTLSWLKDHLETDASLDMIVETLIRIGLEVDTVVDPGAKLAPSSSSSDSPFQRATARRSTTAMCS